jgi:hypothetical protein
MSKDRDRLAVLLEGKRKVGLVTEQKILQTLAEFDAMEATKLMPLYALISTAMSFVAGCDGLRAERYLEQFWCLS